ncbi:MAG: hypothetical protein QUV06_05855 [Cyanobium sp. CZS 48M]|nr:hypothetical protein [Cyanobium sp. CZS48M]
MALPHHFRESQEGTGYGSGRSGARFSRCLALARCLEALVQLERSRSDQVLNIGDRCLEPTEPLQQGGHPLPAIHLDIHLFTSGENALDEVLDLFQGRLHRHRLELEDPRQLPLAARDFLIAATPNADLSLYLEDDLVLSDPLFLDKQLWFLRGSGGKVVLMPHRHELIPGTQGQRLLVDGPLRDGLIRRFTQPQMDAGRGRFWDGQEIRFDRTANPHSGMFCLDQRQVTHLRGQQLPREGFVGPLETAATLTALAHFMVMKPSYAHRNFLWVEHGHPSFGHYGRTLPQRTEGT